MSKKVVKKIVSLYLRCSTIYQKNEGFTIEAQEEMCKDLCKEKGYEIYNIYKEPDVSGSKPLLKRPVFRKLMEDARNKKFSCIIIAALDRFGRNLMDSKLTIIECEKLGIELISCRERFIDSTTATGKFMINILLGTAEYELDLIKERIKCGNEAKMRINGWIGKKIPYGYMKTEDQYKDDIPMINEDEAKVVRYIYKLYHEDKLNASKILEKVRHIPLKRSKNSSWNRNTVMIILVDHKNKYEGDLINNNENGIRWPKILDKIYPNVIVNKRVTTD